MFDKNASEKIEVKSRGERGRVNRIYCGERDGIGFSVSVDLCPSCVKSFQKWINKHYGGKNDRP